jgi:hypothetical protein
MTMESRIRVELRWSKFSKLTDARAVFPHQACVYVQADGNGRPLRVGKASKGLEERYRGGNGYAMDAAMHQSGNLVFVAPVEMGLCKPVEDELIWQGRRVLTYNNQGKLMPPSQRILIDHAGEPPLLADFGAAT